eukprot:scaffold133452_cov24-Prasinocladus_malaysianus.AAC.1
MLQTTWCRRLKPRPSRPAVGALALSSSFWGDNTPSSTNDTRTECGVLSMAHGMLAALQFITFPSTGMLPRQEWSPCNLEDCAACRR